MKSVQFPSPFGLLPGLDSGLRKMSEIRSIYIHTKLADATPAPSQLRPKDARTQLSSRIRSAQRRLNP